MSGLTNGFLVQVSSFINLTPHTHTKQLQYCKAIPYYITLLTAADLGSVLVLKKRGEGGGGKEVCKIFTRFRPVLMYQQEGSYII